MALDAGTFAVIGVALAGVAIGIGVLAFTERQGERSGRRGSTQPCVACGGQGSMQCGFCNGSGRLDGGGGAAGEDCSYCEGRGTVPCTNCGGSGRQPRFLDRMDPDDFIG